MKRHIDLTVSGKVQGVSYRMHAKEQADRLGLTGFAQNAGETDVQIEVEGEDQALGAFLEWAKTGPFHATVEAVAVSEGELQNFSDFAVRTL